MRSVRDFDNHWTNAIQDLPKSAKQFMVSVSFLGEPLLVLAVGLAGLISATIRGQKSVQHAFVYAAIAFALSTTLKLILKRARPQHLELRTFGIRSYSFPSGHAFGTVIFYGLFSYLDLKYLAEPWNVIVSLFLWALIITIGLSRVYLKAHYPSDVVGGWLLGLISLLAVISLAF
jgi:undecaprenyl-diphosphatase